MNSSWLSIYLLAPGLAWLAAQMIKTALAMRHDGHMGLYREFLGSGGMPSSHSSITTALLVVVGARAGWGSALFGIAFVLTAVVIYDALNVRRSVGEQGAVLKKLAANAGMQKPFYRSNGHRPLEVIVGCLLGVAVAVVLLQIL